MSRRLPASSAFAAVLLACRPDGAWAAGADWLADLRPEFEAAVATAQTERGLAYLETPMAEASLNVATGAGWSLGATAAKTFHGPQAALSASMAYGWPLAPGFDAYVALGRTSYYDRDSWRYRHADVRATVNAFDRLFVSATFVFDRRVDTPGVSTPGVSTPGVSTRAGPALAKEAVWRQPLPAGLTLVAGAGHAAQRHRPQASYWYGNLGINIPVGRAMLDASWIATDARARRSWGTQAGSRWVVSLRQGW